MFTVSIESNLEHLGSIKKNTDGVGLLFRRLKFRHVKIISHYCTHSFFFLVRRKKKSESYLLLIFHFFIVNLF